MFHKENEKIKEKSYKTKNLVSGSNSQIYSRFFKIAEAINSGNLSFQEIFSQIEDCQARLYILQSMSNFQIGCNRARAMDPKCIHCLFYRNGQVILNFKRDGRNE